MSTLTSTELIFPFTSITLVTAGIPKTQSHYYCQVPTCNSDSAQKAADCNHVWHDHLNVVLACLYCSFEDNPKMHWYSATAWEHHTMKHLKDNMSIIPDDPTFTEKFIPQSSGDAAPSTSKQVSPHKVG